MPRLSTIFYSKDYFENRNIFKDYKKSTKLLDNDHLTKYIKENEDLKMSVRSIEYDEINKVIDNSIKSNIESLFNFNIYSKGFVEFKHDYNYDNFFSESTLDKDDYLMFSPFEVSLSHNSKAEDTITYRYPLPNLGLGRFKLQLENNIVTAVLDTGINLNHPSITNNILEKEGKKLYINNLGDGFMMEEKHQLHHSTEMSSIIAGNHPNRYYGIAPNTKILPIKIINSYTQNNKTVTESRLDIIIEAFKLARENGAKVINNSWIIKGDISNELKEKLDKEINICFDKGIIICFATGNPSVEANNYFIKSTKSISVASVKSNSNIKIDNSCFNENGEIDIYAVGENVYTSFNQNDNYHYSNGTSCSTAIVSGAIALALSMNPNLTYQEIIRSLNETGNTVMQQQDEPTNEKSINISNFIDNIL